MDVNNAPKTDYPTAPFDENNLILQFLIRNNIKTLMNVTTISPHITYFRIMLIIFSRLMDSQ